MGLINLRLFWPWSPSWISRAVTTGRLWLNGWAVATILKLLLLRLLLNHLHLGLLHLRHWHHWHLWHCHHWHLWHSRHWHLWHLWHCLLHTALWTWLRLSAVLRTHLLLWHYYCYNLRCYLRWYYLLLKSFWRKVITRLFRLALWTPYWTVVRWARLRASVTHHWNRCRDWAACWTARWWTLLRADNAHTTFHYCRRLHYEGSRWGTSRRASLSRAWIRTNAGTWLRWTLTLHHPTRLASSRTWWWLAGFGTHRWRWRSRHRTTTRASWHLTWLWAWLLLWHLLLLRLYQT